MIAGRDVAVKRDMYYETLKVSKNLQGLCTMAIVFRPLRSIKTPITLCKTPLLRG